MLAKTKTECLEKLQKLRDELLKSKPSNTDMSFGEWMDFWFREYASPRLKASTRETYRYRIYKQIIPKIGHIPLKELTQNNLQTFYSSLKREGRVIRTEIYGEGLSDAHIRSIHNHCKAALKKAVAEKLIQTNPAIGCKLPPKKTREMQILTKDEMRRLMIQAKEDGFYEMFLLDLSTGMRRGELLGLQWDDIDFNTGELCISRQINTVDGDRVISDPKTKTSIRTIVLAKPIVQMLSVYRQTVKSKWIFPSPLNPELPRDPSACRKQLSKILERAQCKHVRFHDMRHTFATMALENGLDIKTLASMLGHNTVETTLNSYSHVTEEMQRSAAEKIDHALGNVPTASEASSSKRASTDETKEKPSVTRFEAYKGKKRKPGTGYVKQLSPNCWQGRYTPTVDGVRRSMNIYAPTEEACEVMLAELIAQVKAERA